jgi:hypothetical protein
MNEDATVVFDGLAVRRARMVKPSCAIAAATTVNHPSVRQAEQERVAGDAFAPVPANSITPSGNFTLVLEDALVGC